MTDKHKDLVYWCLVALIAAIALHIYNAKADDDFCVTVHDLAEQIMIARQNGTPITDIIVDDNKIVEILARMAYREPIYGDNEVGDTEVSRFASARFLDCLEAGE